MDVSVYNANNLFHMVFYFTDNWVEFQRQRSEKQLPYLQVTGLVLSDVASSFEDFLYVLSTFSSNHIFIHQFHNSSIRTFLFHSLIILMGNSSLLFYSLPFVCILAAFRPSIYSFTHSFLI